jgi:hypothetical protein
MMEGSPDRVKTNKKLMHLLGVDQKVISTNDQLVNLRAQALSKQKVPQILCSGFFNGNVRRRTNSENRSRIYCTLVTGNIMSVMTIRTLFLWNLKTAEPRSKEQL